MPLVLSGVTLEHLPFFFPVVLAHRQIDTALARLDAYDFGRYFFSHRRGFRVNDNRPGIELTIVSLADEKKPLPVKVLENEAADLKKMALISQSTQPPWKFERLAAFMVNRAHELKIVNSVCPVTIRRQEDTVELAKSVDFIVVVGGRQSANTRELTRLCEIVGTPAIQVERADELVATITRFIESCVRERPSEWLWIHKRWVDKNAPLRKRASALTPPIGS